MCGRFSIDETVIPEIEAIVGYVDSRLRGGFCGGACGRDIHPSEEAPVLAADSCGKMQNGPCIAWYRWGVPGFDGKRLIFNARAESAAEKRMFREGVRAHRVAVPGSSFYEWNGKKEKFTFRRTDGEALFMAGFCVWTDGGERFVILTTEANESMAPVHSRMPLILEKNEVVSWITEEERLEEFLKKRPGPLERQSDYEQLSLF